MNPSQNFLTLFKTKRGKREQDRESESIGRLGREELWPWVPGHRRCCNAALLTVGMGSTSQLHFLFFLSLPPLKKPLQVYNTNATQTCTSVSRSQTLKIQCKNSHYFLYHLAYHNNIHVRCISAFSSTLSMSNSSVPWSYLGLFSFIVWRMYCSWMIVSLWIPRKSKKKVSKYIKVYGRSMWGFQFLIHWKIYRLNMLMYSIRNKQIFLN